MLHRPVQLLRLERDQVRERDLAKLDRHVQDSRDLDRQLVVGLGDPQVAGFALAGSWVRPVGLWHCTLLRPSPFLCEKYPCSSHLSLIPPSFFFLVLVQ